MTDLVRHLAAASDAVAAANHATYDGPTTATDAYDVVGSLDELVRRLPQVVGHLARSLGRADPDGYFDDRGCPPDRALRDAAGALQTARGGLDALGVLVANTHNVLGHLGRNYDPED